MEEKQEESLLTRSLRQLYQSRHDLSWEQLLREALGHFTKALDADAGCLWINAEESLIPMVVYTDPAKDGEHFQSLLETQMQTPPNGLTLQDDSEPPIWILSVPIHSPIPLAHVAFKGTIVPPTNLTLEKAAGLLTLICHQAQVASVSRIGKHEDDWLQRYHLLNTALENVSRIETIPAALTQLLQAAVNLLGGDSGAALYQGMGPTGTKPIEIGDQDCLEILKRLRVPAHGADSRFKETILHIIDAWNLPYLVDIAQRSGLHTLLALPLWPYTETMGMLLICRRDIAAFSQQERALGTILANQATLTIHNTCLFQEEQEQRQLAEAMTQALQALIQSLDFNEVLDEILAQLDRVVPHDASNVMFIQNDEAHVVRRRGYREFISDSSVMSEVTLPLDLPDIQRMLKHKEPLLIPNTVDSDLWVETETSRWIKSYVGGPIMIGDEVVGFVNVDSATEGFFNETHRRRLAAFTDYVALAVQNARLFQEIQQQQLYLENLNAVTEVVISTQGLGDVLRKGLQQALQITHLTYGAVYLWNQDTRTLELEGAEGLPPSAPETLQILHPEDHLISQAFVDREPTYAVDRDTSISPNASTSLFQVAIPLTLESQTIGVMSLGASVPTPPSKDHLQYLQAINDQLALAVRRAQLSQQLREQLQALQYLYEAGTGLMTQMDMQGAIFILLRTLCDILSDSLGAAYYTSGDHAWRRMKIYTKPDAPNILPLWEEKEVEEDEIGFLDTCQEKQSRVIISHQGGHDTAFLNQARALGIRQVAYIPLKLPKGELLGIAGVLMSEINYIPTQRSALIQALTQEWAAAMNRIQLYEKSRREESQMRAILESSQDGVFLIGDDQSVCYVNERALELLNMSKSRGYWEGRPFADVIEFLQDESPPLARCLTDYVTSDKSLDGPTATENEVDIFETALGRQLTPRHQYVYSSRKKLLGTLILLRDVTEQQSLERMRGDLLHMLVHDMRNPLAVVINALQLLQDPEMRDLSQEINQLALSNAEQALTLVNAILDINKLESGQFDIQQRACSLTSLLDFLDQHALVDEKKVNLARNIPEDLPQAFIDPTVVRRIFQNLVDNALKFVLTEEGVIRIAAKQEGEQITVEVFNNGPHISPEIKDQIFDKFITSNYEKQGYGLGLAFCRLAVETHGGKIWAENRPEGGVSFYFTLPVAD